MEAYTDAPEGAVVFVAAKDLLHSRFDLPQSSDEGFIRSIGRGVRGQASSLGIGRLPVGQGSPVHAADCEHLLLGLEGTIAWIVDGVEHVMNPMDLLYVGDGIFYEYRNVGKTDAVFVDVCGRLHTWPATGMYDHQ